MGVKRWALPIGIRGGKQVDAAGTSRTGASGCSGSGIQSPSSTNDQSGLLGGRKRGFAAPPVGVRPAHALLPKSQIKIARSGGATAPSSRFVDWWCPVKIGRAHV